MTPIEPSQDAEIIEETKPMEDKNESEPSPTGSNEPTIKYNTSANDQNNEDNNNDENCYSTLLNDNTSEAKTDNESTTIPETTHDVEEILKEEESIVHDINESMEGTAPYESNPVDRKEDNHVADVDDNIIPTITTNNAVEEIVEEEELITHESNKSTETTAPDESIPVDQKGDNYVTATDNTIIPIITTADNAHDISRNDDAGPCDTKNDVDEGDEMKQQLAVDETKELVSSVRDDDKHHQENEGLVTVDENSSKSNNDESKQNDDDSKEEAVLTTMIGLTDLENHDVGGTEKGTSSAAESVVEKDDSILPSDLTQGGMADGFIAGQSLTNDAFEQQPPTITDIPDAIINETKSMNESLLIDDNMEMKAENDVQIHQCGSDANDAMVSSGDAPSETMVVASNNVESDDPQPTEPTTDNNNTSNQLIATEDGNQCMEETEVNDKEKRNDKLITADSPPTNSNNDIISTINDNRPTSPAAMKDDVKDDPVVQGGMMSLSSCSDIKPEDEQETTTTTIKTALDCVNSSSSDLKEQVVSNDKVTSHTDNDTEMASNPKPTEAKIDDSLPHPTAITSDPNESNDINTDDPPIKKANNATTKTIDEKKENSGINDDDVSLSQSSSRSEQSKTEMFWNRITQRMTEAAPSQSEDNDILSGSRSGSTNDDNNSTSTTPKHQRSSSMGGALRGFLSRKVSTTFGTGEVTKTTSDDGDLSKEANINQEQTSCSVEDYLDDFPSAVEDEISKSKETFPDVISPLIIATTDRNDEEAAGSSSSDDEHFDEKEKSDDDDDDSTSSCSDNTPPPSSSKTQFPSFQQHDNNTTTTTTPPRDNKPLAFWRRRGTGRAKRHSSSPQMTDQQPQQQQQRPLRQGIMSMLTMLREDSMRFEKMNSSQTNILTPKTQQTTGTTMSTTPEMTMGVTKSDNVTKMTQHDNYKDHDTDSTKEEEDCCAASSMDDDQDTTSHTTEINERLSSSSSSSEHDTRRERSSNTVESRTVSRSKVGIDVPKWMFHLNQGRTSDNMTTVLSSTVTSNTNDVQPKIDCYQEGNDKTLSIGDDIEQSLHSLSMINSDGIDSQEQPSSPKATTLSLPITKQEDLNEDTKESVITMTENERLGLCTTTSLVDETSKVTTQDVDNDVAKDVSLLKNTNNHDNEQSSPTIVSSSSAISPIRCTLGVDDNDRPLKKDNAPLIVNETKMTGIDGLSSNGDIINTKIPLDVTDNNNDHAYDSPQSLVGKNKHGDTIHSSSITKEEQQPMEQKEMTTAADENMSNFLVDSSMTISSKIMDASSSHSESMTDDNNTCQQSEVVTTTKREDDNDETANVAKTKPIDIINDTPVVESDETTTEMPTAIVKEQPMSYGSDDDSSVEMNDKYAIPSSDFNESQTLDINDNEHATTGGDEEVIIATTKIPKINMDETLSSAAMPTGGIAAAAAAAAKKKNRALSTSTEMPAGGIAAAAAAAAANKKKTIAVASDGDTPTGGIAAAAAAAALKKSRTSSISVEIPAGSIAAAAAAAAKKNKASSNIDEIPAGGIAAAAAAAAKKKHSIVLSESDEISSGGIAAAAATAAAALKESRTSSTSVEMPAGGIAAAAAAAAAAKKNKASSNIDAIPAGGIAAAAAAAATAKKSTNKVLSGSIEIPAGGIAAIAAAAAAKKKQSISLSESDEISSGGIAAASTQKDKASLSNAEMPTGGIAAAAAAAAALKKKSKASSNIDEIPAGGIAAAAAAAAAMKNKVSSSKADVTEADTVVKKKNKVSFSSIENPTKGRTSAVAIKAKKSRASCSTIVLPAGGIAAAAAAAAAKKKGRSSCATVEMPAGGIAALAAAAATKKKKKKVPSSSVEKKNLESEKDKHTVAEITNTSTSENKESQSIYIPCIDIPLKEDPDYVKYFKMLKMGLPMGAVKNALVRDGKDPSIMDLDPDKSLKSQTGNDADEGPPLKEDPDYMKYFKMLKMGLPVGAVKNALVRDGKDPSIMDLDPDKSLKSQTDDAADEGPPLKDDPDYTKYFKMLKMGLPMGAVKNALVRDGKDPSIMDLDPEKSLKNQTDNDADEGPPLKEDPDFVKYFKMLKMGLPMGAVKNALVRDGKDPSIMDLDPEKSLLSQQKRKNQKPKKPKVDDKPKVKRKRLFWNSITQVSRSSIWAELQSASRSDIHMDNLKFDQDEFEKLFVATICPKNEKQKKPDETKKQKNKKVQIIDGKRVMNGGIILAKIKVDYASLATQFHRMDPGDFDVTQLSALQQFLASDEESHALNKYISSLDSNEREDCTKSLSECEKYMLEMMKVKNINAKFDCMLYQIQFESRYREFYDELTSLEKACDDVRASPKLKKLLAMVLMLGNYINNGKSSSDVAGFRLESLLKLNEAKAFDKKTSVLHYLVKLVKQNDESLLNFKKDILSVEKAERITLEATAEQLKRLSKELEEVKKTVQQDKSPKNRDHIPHRTYNLKDYDQDQLDTLPSSRIDKFIFVANKKIESGFNSLEVVQMKYIETLKYFGEDTKVPSHEFFGTLQGFILVYDMAVTHIVKEEENAKRAAKLEAKRIAKEEEKRRRLEARQMALEKMNASRNLNGHVLHRSHGSKNVIHADDFHFDLKSRRRTGLSMSSFGGVGGPRGARCSPNEVIVTDNSPNQKSNDSKDVNTSVVVACILAGNDILNENEDVEVLLKEKGKKKDK